MFLLLGFEKMLMHKTGLKLNLNKNPAMEIHTHQLFLLNVEHCHALTLLSEAVSERKAPRALGATVVQRQKGTT